MNMGLTLTPKEAVEIASAHADARHAEARYKALVAAAARKRSLNGDFRFVLSEAKFELEQKEPNHGE